LFYYIHFLLPIKNKIKEITQPITTGIISPIIPMPSPTPPNAGKDFKKIELGLLFTTSREILGLISSCLEIPCALRTTFMEWFSTK